MYDKIKIKWEKHDDYTTPYEAWEDIKEYIPSGKVIWEAFYCNGTSGEHLRKLGFETIHEDIDFFKENRGDIIVSNPPYSIILQVLKRLEELDKPFILLMPVGKLSTQYFKKSKFHNNISIIIPKKRINFDKQKDEKKVEKISRSSFDCYYYCYKIPLPSQIVFL